MQTEKNQKPITINTDEYFTLLVISSVVISSIISMSAIFKKPMLTSTLWADIPMRILFFVVSVLVILYLQIILITLFYHLYKILKGRLKRYVIRNQYSLYFKRFDSMLPGESINLINIEKKEEFIDAANEYINYKYYRGSIINDRLHGISSDNSTFYRK